MWDFALWAFEMEIVWLYFKISNTAACKYTKWFWALKARRDRQLCSSAWQKMHAKCLIWKHMHTHIHTLARPRTHLRCEIVLPAVRLQCQRTSALAVSMYLCVCACVFWYLLHIEYNITLSTSKVRTSGAILAGLTTSKDCFRVQTWF